jgi:hypothetical protein
MTLTGYKAITKRILLGFQTVNLAEALRFRDGRISTHKNNKKTGRHEVRTTG